MKKKDKDAAEKVLDEKKEIFYKIYNDLKLKHGVRFCVFCGSTPDGFHSHGGDFGPLMDAVIKRELGSKE